MRFAVIGASSFSGKAFVEEVRELGVAEFSRPEWDLARPQEIKEALDQIKPSFIVNFAALNMVAESWKYAADYYRTNVVGVTSLADQLVGAPYLQCFVQVSTPEVYGTTVQFLKEDNVYRPSTPYAVSRAAADMHLFALHKTKEFPVCFTRTVNVYGPGQQPYRIIPKTVLKILRKEKLKLHGGGHSERSFIHIRDVARATRLVAVAGRSGHTYHIATPEQTSIRDLVARVCARMGVEFDSVVENDKERAGKDMQYQLDDSKIRQELLWISTISLEAGLAETVDWFAANAARYEGRSLEYEHRP